LDGIREEAAQWARQELRLKREKPVRELQLTDTLEWPNRVVAKVLGENLELTQVEVFDKPQAIGCTAKNGRQVVFSPVSPVEVRRTMREYRSRLSGRGIGCPMHGMPHRCEILQLSILNAGILFDLEMPIT